MPALACIINDLALSLYSVARTMDGVETLRLNASRRITSDSRYLNINRGLGNQAVIRMSSHYAPDDNFDLNFLVKNEKDQNDAIRIATEWLRRHYGPEISQAA